MRHWVKALCEWPKGRQPAQGGLERLCWLLLVQYSKPLTVHLCSLSCLSWLILGALSSLLGLLYTALVSSALTALNQFSYTQQEQISFDS